MTVQQFLEQTPIPFALIAEEVGVHVSRLYDWEKGRSIPGGVELARLIIFSESTGTPITLEAMADCSRARVA